MLQLKRGWKRGFARSHLTSLVTTLQIYLLMRGWLLRDSFLFNKKLEEMSNVVSHLTTNGFATAYAHANQFKSTFLMITFSMFAIKIKPHNFWKSKASKLCFHHSILHHIFNS